MAGPEQLTEREAAAWRAFMEMQQVLRGRLEQQLQQDSSLSNADYTVLVVLSEADDGCIRAHQLTRQLQWEKSRVHHHLTRMSRRGLVERYSASGRTSYAAITPAGRDALRSAAPAHTREVRRLMLDQLTEKQVDELAEISQTILAHLRPK